MWSIPEDAAILPSERDLDLAIGAINALRKEQEELLAQAEKLRQQASDRELKIVKINAWLAPIRRVPADVLSLVFIEVCQEDWKAPKVLGIVCRHWREVLLNTPRAWACIHIGPRSTYVPLNILSLWLSRCGACKLHASFSTSTKADMAEVVCRHGANLQCLSLFHHFHCLRHDFPQLQELRLGPEKLLFGSAPELAPELTPLAEKKEGENESSTILSLKRFPKLVCLHLHSPALEVMEDIAHEALFPALRELHIHTYGSQWHRIIRNCAQSLITLAVEVSRLSEKWAIEDLMETPIELPNLQNLHYIFNAFWYLDPPKLETPNLQAYYQVGGTPMLVHPQASLASHIFLKQPQSVHWTKFSSMTHLQITDVPHRITQLLEELQVTPQLCPLLTSVKCISFWISSHEKTDAEACITQRSKITGTQIQFQYLESRTGGSHMGYSLCYTYCKCDMPAAEQRDYYGENSYHPPNEGDSEQFDSELSVEEDYGYGYDDSDYDDGYESHGYYGPFGWR
ncbi:hypothetical protein M408DRAFT_21669 [Serendipita vermifera MAFF 305830]|uniref:F-box domain-containing protein n=1 Tax=Serendipita vermifera MAFF 305830 TaxID=933852 RepID=A0A0C3BHA2_SERVB|nr:hypothetical protein M408DRAFT_21669 [Serendipita vermifera MAFF 305830]